MLFLLGLCCIPEATASRTREYQPGDLNLKRSLGQPEGTAWLTRGWSYHAGDDTTWASPDFDHSAWPVVASRIDPDVYPDGGWQGIGWFRLTIDFDSLRFEPPLGMMLMLAGAAEVYLDGHLVFRVGSVGATPETTIPLHSYRPVSVPIVASGGEHTIAVRLAQWNWAAYKRLANNSTGFWLWVGEAAPLADLAVHRARQISKYLYFFTGAAFAFAVLHLLLFLYFPLERANLYYAIHTIGIATLTYIGYSTSFTTDQAAFLRMMWGFKLAILLAMIYALRFTYHVFYDRTPLVFRFLVPVALLLALSAWWLPLTWVYIFTLLLFVEMIRVILVSVLRQRSGAWIVGLGLFALVAAGSIQIVNELTLGPEGPRVENIYLYGVMAFLVSMSILLARNSARTKQSLLEQVDQVRLLSLKSLEQERHAREQEMETLRLAQEKERVERELQVAHEREQLLEQLETANRDLEATNRHLRDTQAQLVQSEKMASLGNLVAGIAHEINTPIGAVSSMHETLLKGTEKLRMHLANAPTADPTDQQSIERVLRVIDEANRVIRTGIDRVTTIVRRLRSFARLDEAELKMASVEEGLEDTLSLMQHEFKHKIRIIREYGNVGMIACYPGRLNQVFLNLIHNARQAIETEGTITIRTRLENDQAVIEIADNGKGIPKEDQIRIFDPGFTTKGVKVGTGLGLSISYQIIEEHAGRIDLSSEPGVGTTFTIRLPLNLARRVSGEGEKVWPH